jgi:hypothetical protein
MLMADDRASKKETMDSASTEVVTLFRGLRSGKTRPTQFVRVLRMVLVSAGGNLPSDPERFEQPVSQRFRIRHRFPPRPLPGWQTMAKDVSRFFHQYRAEEEPHHVREVLVRPDFRASCESLQPTSHGHRFAAIPMISQKCAQHLRRIFIAPHGRQRLRD